MQQQLYFLSLLLSIFWSSSHLTAQKYHVEYDSQFSDIYQDIIDLKLVGARKKLDTYRQYKPENLAYIHLENYIDFFELFISENEERFQVLEKEKDNRINIIKQNLSDEDPYEKYLIAEIQLQWALTRGKFGSFFKAGTEIYSAYQLLEENKKDHPDFIYNLKSLSIIHAIIETVEIPGLIKKILGMQGSITLGINEIEEVLRYAEQQTFAFKQEADAIYSYILFYQANQKAEAFRYIQNCSLDHRKSLLANFIKVKIAQKAGKNKLALQWLSERPKGQEYSKFAYLEFMEGMCRMHNLDPECVTSFHNYIAHFEGRHYIKEAYQKLAWAALIFDNNPQEYSRLIHEVTLHGQDQMEADIQAQKESESEVIPHPILLKARILFDGGSYDQAFILLSQNSDICKLGSLNKLEYAYRMGRILHASNQLQESIHYYQQVIEMKGMDNLYHKCNAALQLGLIYESLKDWDMAEMYFRKCLKHKPDEYRISLHQKAKSGLQRLLK